MRFPLRLATYPVGRPRNGGIVEAAAISNLSAESFVLSAFFSTFAADFPQVDVYETIFDSSGCTTDDSL